MRRFVTGLRIVYFLIIVTWVIYRNNIFTIFSLGWSYLDKWILCKYCKSICKWRYNQKVCSKSRKNLQQDKLIST